jgi:hypothetical protein
MNYHKTEKGGSIMGEAKKVKELEEGKAEELSAQQKEEVREEKLDAVNGGAGFDSKIVPSSKKL